MPPLPSCLKPEKERSVPDEIHQFRTEFDALLKEAQIEQLVVLIDDLDRCLPATAIDTMEALRLFLFVPKTAFIIGADEGMIEYAVRQHFPDLPIISSPIPYPRHYLEKLIQVPFRIPALGVQEVRVYVILLLVQALVGEHHDGFAKLLLTARDRLNKPWIDAGLSQGEVRAVETTRQRELDAAFLLAQQIGPILAEGSSGNPRQIKRFLNGLFVRRTIAKARGFADSVNQAVLAKLMLAERFQADFYDYLAGAAMPSEDGQVKELQELEAAAARQSADEREPKKERRKKQPPVQLDPDNQKWFEREWLQRWLTLTPALGTTDLRPYVFVARDKRVLVAVGEVGDLESLIELLSGPELAARSAEQQVKALPPAKAAQVFAALRERVIRHGSFDAPPPGFGGLRIVAKHHSDQQTELLGLLGGIDVKALGVWVVKGWSEILSDPKALQQLRKLFAEWAAQEENSRLKRVAEKAVVAQARTVH